MKALRLITVFVLVTLISNHLMAINIETSERCILVVLKSEVNGIDTSQRSKNSDQTLAIYISNNDVCLSNALRKEKTQSYGILHLAKVEQGFDKESEFFIYSLLWEYNNSYDNQKGLAVVTLFLEDKYVEFSIETQDGAYKAKYHAIIVEGDIKRLLSKCRKVTRGITN